MNYFSINAEHSTNAGFRIFNPPSIESPEWTDNSFILKTCNNQFGHQESPVILLQGHLDLIIGFPPDPMHVLYRYLLYIYCKFSFATTFKKRI